MRETWFTSSIIASKDMPRWHLYTYKRACIHAWGLYTWTCITYVNRSSLVLPIFPPQRTLSCGIQQLRSQPCSYRWAAFQGKTPSAPLLGQVPHVPRLEDRRTCLERESYSVGKLCRWVVPVQTWIKGRVLAATLETTATIQFDSPDVQVFRCLPASVWLCFRLCVLLFPYVCLSASFNLFLRPCVW